LILSPLQGGAVPPVGIFNRRSLFPGSPLFQQAPPPAAGPGEPNPNLLRWSEKFDESATWVPTNATVTPNVGTDPTADRVAFGANGALRQTTAIAVSTGDVALVIIATDGTRQSVSGVFDGTTYVFSLTASNGGAEFRARLDRAGGFLRVSVEDSGDEATFDLAKAKLETPDLTDYIKREGT